MKALLYKDITAAKGSYLLALAIGLAICAYGVLNDLLIFIPFIFIFLSLVVSAISFGIDEQAQFHKFIFTTPVSRKSYVMSKYTITVILAALASLVSLGIFNFTNEGFGLTVILAAIIYAIPIIIISIQVPFSIKYNADKGRMLLVAIYFALFALTNYIGSRKADLIGEISSLSKKNPYIIAITIFIIANLILFASFKIAYKLIEDKDY